MLDTDTVSTNGSSSDTNMNMKERKGMKKIDKPEFNNQSRCFIDKMESIVPYSPIAV